MNYFICDPIFMFSSYLTKVNYVDHISDHLIHFYFIYGFIINELSLLLQNIGYSLIMSIKLQFPPWLGLLAWYNMDYQVSFILSSE